MCACGCSHTTHYLVVLAGPVGLRVAVAAVAAGFAAAGAVVVVVVFCVGVAAAVAAGAARCGWAAGDMIAGGVGLLCLFKDAGFVSCGSGSVMVMPAVVNWSRSLCTKSLSLSASDSIVSMSCYVKPCQLHDMR